jgi:hypothetical protein
MPMGPPSPWFGDGRDSSLVGALCLFESDDGRWCLAGRNRQGVINIWDVGAAPPPVVGVRSALKKG